MRKAYRIDLMFLPAYPGSVHLDRNADQCGLRLNFSSYGKKPFFMVIESLLTRDRSLIENFLRILVFILCLVGFHILSKQHIIVKLYGLLQSKLEE